MCAPWLLYTRRLVVDCRSAQADGRGPVGVENLRYDPCMLKGTRLGILRKVQPISVHGQISWDVHFSDPDDPEGPLQMARVGPESVDRNLEPGDRITLEYLLGSVINVTRDNGAK